MATRAEAVVPRSNASPLTQHRPNPWFNTLAGIIVVAGIIYAGYHLANDLPVVRDTRVYPFVLLGIALFIALGFEFVNGFHDTANAVATVIYTHSMPPNFAVVWSGFFNFLGVVISSGAVAFGIVSLLPVELILQVGSGAGFAMVFALLIAAIRRDHGREPIRPAMVHDPQSPDGLGALTLPVSIALAAGLYWLLRHLL